MTKLSQECRRAIAETMTEIRSILDSKVDVAALEDAKEHLVRLCGRTDLFTFDAFPLPADARPEISYLVHADGDGGYALYINAGKPSQYYRPHNHGGSWAIVGGVQGREQHRMFQETGREDDPIELKATLTVEPGTAVSMLPDGVHSIAAADDQPLLHLHLYQTMFENMKTRREFDEETGEVFSFRMENFGSIVDLR